MKGKEPKKVRCKKTTLLGQGHTKGYPLSQQDSVTL